MLWCAPSAGSVEGVQGRGQAALGRLGGAISPTGTTWEGEEEEGIAGQRRRVGEELAGSQQHCWIQERAREGPSDTEKAPVFLMNLHNRSVAE